MISRNLSRRLERLEEELAPMEVVTVLQIVGVSPDGSQKNGPRFEVRVRRPTAARLPRSPSDLSSRFR
jgi:hypothetical protein